MVADAELMEPGAAPGAARLAAAPPPEPWVGCVLVARRRDRRRGRHAAARRRPRRGRGTAAAGDRARGATAYITLEPCSHHGRTPPCADALVDAGVARVVVALEDPDPHVAGRGIARLREAGIDRRRRRRAERPPPARSRPYLAPPRDGRAFVVLKTAISLDGRIAAARRLLAVDHRARRPAPTRTRCAPSRRRSSSAPAPRSPTGPRSPCATSPDPPSASRCACCSTPPGRVPADGPLFDTELAPTLVVTTEAAPDAVAARGWPRAPRCRRCRRAEPAPASTSRATLDAARAATGCSRRWSRAGATLHGVVASTPGSPTGSSPTSRRVMLGADGRPDARPRRPATASPTRPAGGSSTSPASAPTSASTTSPDRGGAPDVHRHRRGARPRAARSRRTRAAPASRSRPRTVLDDAEIGASIAVNGCCLTVVELGDGWFAADAVTETLDRTDARRARRPGDPVNLERPVRLADRLGGHLVQGHVDAVGHRPRPRRRCADGSSASTFSRARAGRCATSSRRARSPSTAISLTVAARRRRDGRSTVAVIPHTLAVTTLGREAAG